MPRILISAYQPNPLYFKNRHLETIIPSLFNNGGNILYNRERLELEDGDFLDLDWVRGNNERLVILSSGMEGNSGRQYMQRSSYYFSQRGWDVLAWNYRGCSGEINRLSKYYSYADTDDFRTVVKYAASNQHYKSIALIGFSMGGCLTTKLLGESADYPPNIVASVSFSVSCNLLDSMRQTEKWNNVVYKKYFIKRLKEKLHSKTESHPQIGEIPVDKIHSFDDYLTYYNIPFHGFLSTADFYEKSSCNQFLTSIQVPSLMVNALNDPILSQTCFPIEAAESNPCFYLEMPASGGHLGFPVSNQNTNSWMEIRAFEFISQYL